MIMWWLFIPTIFLIQLNWIYQVGGHLRGPTTMKEPSQSSHKQKKHLAPQHQKPKYASHHNETTISVHSAMANTRSRSPRSTSNSSSHRRHHKGRHSVNNTSRESPFHLPFSHDEALAKINYSTGGFFHVYDPHTDHRNGSIECNQYYQMHDSSGEVFHQTVRQYKLWSGLVGEEKMRMVTPNDTLFGFQHAISVIWDHQHPPDCSKVQFLIPTEHTGGFGSELHVLTNPLGLAMDMGRVYLSNPFLQAQSVWELETPFCRNQSNALGFDCYFEPWSSCTIFDALGENALEILHELRKRKYRPASLISVSSKARDMKGLGKSSQPPQVSTSSHQTGSKYPSSAKDVPIFAIDSSHIAHLYSDKFLEQINKFAEERKVLLLHNVYRMGSKYIPRVFRPLVNCSPIIPQFHYYWWRAITMTYFLRPNGKTMAWINEHRNLSFEQAAKNNNVVSIYVRRGDKDREMRISPMSEYIDSMRLIWSLNYLPNMTLPRVIFFASESSTALEQMDEWVRSHNSTYEMYFTTVFDRHGLFAERTAVERDSGAPQIHHSEEYLNMLLNIHHLLQGNAWVCTLGSNFCRVVDELRSTVAAKAGAPYADLSFEKCGQPPCIFGGLIDLDWR
jgi:hypothetical protein